MPKTEGTIIRPAVPADIGARDTGGIRDLFNAVRRHERSRGRAPLGPPVYPAWQRAMERQKTCAETQVLVATQNGIAVAFCLARHPAARTVSSLDKLFVDPALQGQGLGTELLARVIQAARDRGQIALTLQAEAGHDRASAFYQRLGFTVTETRPGTPAIDRLFRPLRS